MQLDEAVNIWGISKNAPCDDPTYPFNSHISVKGAHETRSTKLENKKRECKTTCD